MSTREVGHGPEVTPPFAQSLAVLAPERGGYRGGLLALAVGGLGLASFVAAGFAPGLLGLVLVVFGWFVMRPRPRPLLHQNLTVGPEGLSIDGRLAVRQDRIASGFFEASGRSHSTVRLIGKDGDSILEAQASKAQALALLRALKVDVEHRRVELSSLSPLVSRASAAVTLVAVLGLALLAALLGQVTAVAWMLPMLVPLVALAAVPMSVVVGLDGVFVKWLFQHRFIPASEIVDVQSSLDAGIDLTLRSGEHLVLAATSAVAARAARDRDAMLERIREVISVHRSREECADLRALLARDGRGTAEWAAGLRKLTEGQATYRSSAIRGDDLLRIIEDPAASEEARAGAAFVVRTGSGGADGEARARIRVAAEATASPRLRVALEASAEEEIDDTQALEAFDDAPLHRRASQGQ